MTIHSFKIIPREGNSVRRTKAIDMKRIAVRPTFTAFFLVIAAMCTGCDRQVGGAGSAASNGKPDPKESFQRIMDSFRRKVEDQPVGFVVSEGGSRSTMMGSNKVSSELVPPATAGDHYKAVITVESKSRYSLRRAKNGTEENERDKTAKNQSKSSLSDPGDTQGFPIAEPDAGSKAGSGNESKDSSKSNPSSEEIVTRRQDEKARQYELIYDNNRWSLVTELNPKTEKSIQFAFDEALARQ